MKSESVRESLGPFVFAFLWAKARRRRKFFGKSFFFFDLCFEIENLEKQCLFSDNDKVSKQVFFWNMRKKKKRAHQCTKKKESKPNVKKNLW
jgi:hypothetical protein